MELWLAADSLRSSHDWLSASKNPSFDVGGHSLLRFPPLCFVMSSPAYLAHVSRQGSRKKVQSNVRWSRETRLRHERDLLLPCKLDKRLGVAALIDRHLTTPQTGYNRHAGPLPRIDLQPA